MIRIAPAQSSANPGAFSMKISCPGCGKTYSLPQELIARIIKDHENKTARSSPESFFQSASAPKSPPPVSPNYQNSGAPIFRSRTVIKRSYSKTDWVVIYVFATAGLMALALFVSNMVPDSSKRGLSPSQSALVTAFAVIGIALYLIPTLIAFLRGHPNAGAIAVVNVALGWTFLGYIAALVWSLTAINTHFHGETITHLH
jgi:hypothetical protein